MERLNHFLNKPFYSIGLIALVSMTMHFQIFTLDLQGVHLWRQSQTQINIQNFYRHDNNIFNPRNSIVHDDMNIQRLEFPIMQWIIAQFHRVFGESITITRISVFIIGLMSILGIFQIMQVLFKNPLLSFLTAYSFNFSPVFYYFTMNPMPDNFALCNIIWSLFYFFKFRESFDWQYVFISTLFLTFSTLAKLPFILLGGVYVLYIFSNLIAKKIDFRFFFKFSLIYLLFIMPAIAWYVWVIPTWTGNGVIKGIFDNQIQWEESIKILEFHWKVMFPNILLNEGAQYFLIIGFLVLLFKKRIFKLGVLEIAFSSLFLIFYLLYELNMITIVHTYYMMPFLPHLFLGVGYGIKQLISFKYLKPIISIYILFALPFYAHKEVQDYWSVDRMAPEHIDMVTYKKELRSAIPNNARCIILNDDTGFIYSFLIDKRGFNFNKYLPPEWIKDMIDRQDVHYLYSNDRQFEVKPEVMPFLDSLILERGSIRVYKLKTANLIH